MPKHGLGPVELPLRLAGLERHLLWLRRTARAAGVGHRHFDTLSLLSLLRSHRYFGNLRICMTLTLSFILQRLQVLSLISPCSLHYRVLAFI